MQSDRLLRGCSLTFSPQIIEYLSVGTYYNDHAKIWVSGPGEKPGTPVVYGAGPATINHSTVNESGCPATEGATAGQVGQGQCHFVDSTKSNNWIALRVRNATHNFVYAESFGPSGKFMCAPGDFCQTELYDYGPITSDYPNYPVMTDERWCLHNTFAAAAPEVKQALHNELKAAYCSSRRLDIDRMECT